MARSLTGSTFGVPARAPLSDKVAWLSEARHFYKMKLLELEHHFETEVAELHEEYLAVILQIRGPQEQWEVGYNGEAGRAKRKGGTVTQSMAEQSTLYSRTGSMIPSKHNCEAAALGTSSVVQEA